MNISNRILSIALVGAFVLNLVVLLSRWGAAQNEKANVVGTYQAACASWSAGTYINCLVIDTRTGVAVNVIRPKETL